MPAQIEIDAIQPKWNLDKQLFFEEAVAHFSNAESWVATQLESDFKNLAAAKNIKAGELLLPLRIMLVGKKMGPGVFEIAEIIGRNETIKRIKLVADKLKL